MEKLSQEKINEVIRLLNKGNTVRETVKAANVSQASVYRIIKNNNINLEDIKQNHILNFQQQVDELGSTDKREIAQMLGICQKTLYRYLRLGLLKLPEVQKVKEEVNERITSKEEKKQRENNETKAKVSFLDRIANKVKEIIGIGQEEKEKVEKVTVNYPYLINDQV